jgi:23S rRNA pseudouridine1911/1915/1917 synthase
MDLPVLYEDNHIIMINKHPGEIVQGDKTGDVPLSDIVKSYIKKKYSKPGEVFLGVVHRIDRPVSGIVIFARTSKALARLNQMLKDRQIKKMYWAVVSKDPARSFSRLGQGEKKASEWVHLVHYLKRNQKQNKSYAFETEGTGRLKAETKFRKIAESDRYDLMEIELITGRHHQIRVQLSAIEMPIRGDLKYGYPRSNPDGSIHLHARQVEFIHPVSKKLITVVAPPPEENLWNFFSGNIKE